MTHWLLILATALGPGEVEQDGVRVRTVIESNRYEWHVTNVGADGRFTLLGRDDQGFVSGVSPSVVDLVMVITSWS